MDRMKNRYVNLGKFLHWRVVYKYWILLTIFVQMIIMIFGFNVYTNLITLMIVAVGGTILGLLGLYWLKQREWTNALLMFALFPLQCVAYIVGIFMW